MRLAAFLLLLAASCGPAGAQLVYECRGPDGVAFFSETSCKSQGLRSVGKRGYASGKPSRPEILERWGVTEAHLAAVEKRCDAGDKDGCAQLATYHATTLAQAVRELTHDAVKACRDGHRPSCEALTANKRDVRKSMDDCKAGNKAGCELLSRLAQ